MDFRGKLYSVAESLLRVPPLLIVDEIFRISFGFGGKIIEYSAKSLVGQESQEGASLSDSVGTSTSEKLVNYVSSAVNSASATTSSVLNNPFWIYYNDQINQSQITPLIYHPQHEAHSPGSFNSYSDSSHSSVGGDLFATAGGGRGGGSGKFILDPQSMLKRWLVLGGFISQNGTESWNGGSDYLFQTKFGDLSLLSDGVSWEVWRMGEVLTCLMVFLAALVMFLLSTDTLLKLYSYLASIFTLYLAYMMPPLPLLWSTFSINSLLYALAVRGVLAGAYFSARRRSGCHPSTSPSAPATGDEGDARNEGDGAKTTEIISFPDALLLLLFFKCGVVRLQPVIFLGLILILQNSLWTCLPKAVAFLRDSWNETRRIQNEYGLSHLIQVECARLRVNTVFRLFWISRAFYDAFFRCCDQSLSHVFRYVMSHGTETFTGIVGLTVTVSIICHSIGEFLLYVLYWGTNSETDANRFGSISTVLFFILSLQTGLTSMDPEKRLDRLLKNIVLLGTALFHALHQMVAPLLHAFRTFQGLQIRAACISVTFLSISIYSTVYLLRFSSVSTWSLAVLALAIEFKIKIIISLIISSVVYLSQLVQYPESLQKITNLIRMCLPKALTRLVDKLADQLSHEDMVFYLKSFANVAEFLTGIFLFVNAVWIFMFESASAIRAIGMTIHAYFNIWCEARKGWKIYSQRKTASMKIMSLADATDEQLATRKDDVCAICYEEMESAKVTLCGHLFHAVCLRKWLYVQNTCPLCHELLYGEDVLEDLNRAQFAQEGGEGGIEAPDHDDDDDDEDDGDDDIFDNYAAYSSSTPLNPLSNNNISDNNTPSNSSSSSSAAVTVPASIQPSKEVATSQGANTSLKSHSHSSTTALESQRLNRGSTSSNSSISGSSSASGSSSVGDSSTTMSSVSTISSSSYSPNSSNSSGNSSSSTPGNNGLPAAWANLPPGRNPLPPPPRDNNDPINLVQNNHNNANFHPNNNNAAVNNGRARGGGLAVLL